MKENRHNHFGSGACLILQVMKGTQGASNKAINAACLLLSGDSNCYVPTLCNSTIVCKQSLPMLITLGMFSDRFLRLAFGPFLQTR